MGVTGEDTMATFGWAGKVDDELEETATDDVADVTGGVTTVAFDDEVGVEAPVVTVEPLEIILDVGPLVMFELVSYKVDPALQFSLLLGMSVRLGIGCEMVVGGRIKRDCLCVVATVFRTSTLLKVDLYSCG